MDRAYESTIDSLGHLDLPDTVRARHGLHTGSKVMIEDRESEIVIKMPIYPAELSRMKEAIKKSVGILGADSQGKVVGGHCLEGCSVFAVEFVIWPFHGPPLRRVADLATGLNLLEEDLYSDEKK